MKRFAIAADVIDTDALRAELQDGGNGGFCVFEGWVRNRNEGRAVDGLEYEAYAELAQSEGERILAEAGALHGVDDLCCVHRTGHLKVGELAVWIGAASAHRDEAFRACRYVIDALKHRLPVWKKEHYLEGDTAWVACHHAHGEHSRTFAPDYTRQTRLREVGTEGQARLAAARVLVLGAGGLGSPALTYLAGAGVGTLGIVDGDRLEASNLHRQTLYDARDVGLPKATLAARRLAALNPSVTLRTWTEPLHAGNAADVFADFDLVLECTDDMRNRYLSNDAAVVAGIPLILASVYQYEGQLQVVEAGGTPCLRCLWPREPAADAIGSCAANGVLGPTPGVLGAMQAMEALKILLDLPRPREPALLLVDLLQHDLRRLPIDPATGCAEHGGCAAVARKALAEAQRIGDVDRRFTRLDEAAAAGYRLVDVRDAEEIATHPADCATLHIPAAQIAERAAALGEDRCLLFCATGRRSRDAAERLRRQGRGETYSLLGGLAALDTERARTHS
ncbi:ThiF family adenylyltransferase [Oleiagrimonas soli]|uniref:Molybdopterin synthase catalytic subunit n=1 Tax=Oleiagrimonas soli TaxID=1543381 RepID=A0A099CSZ4_9GAMM|nr:ThiF family adenylyltransferase [Oleiagrimonas soli]KGI76757.1 molybdopterin converting factor [Oleiagrimonas soli]MBB6185005.1 adenylyltransferase/sulfurtransferase [Oleiagrimonas soli]